MNLRNSTSAAWPQPVFSADNGGAAGGGGGGAGGGGDGGGDGGAPAGGAGVDWLETISPASREIATRNGFKDIDQVFSSLADTQAKLGRPADRLLALPGDDADDAAWQEIYGRLGRPENADGYEFPALQGAAEEADKAVAAAAHRLGLTPRQANAMREIYYENEAERADADEQRISDGVAAVQEGLVAKFGEFADAEKAKIDRGISWLAGGDKRIAETIERAGLSGDPAFVERLRQFGELLTGDGRLLGGGHGASGFGSPAAAEAELNRMADDPETKAALYDRNHVDHKKVAARYAELAQTAYPEPDAA